MIKKIILILAIISPFIGYYFTVYLLKFEKKIIKNNKEVSLRINEGFLNSFTLKRLFNLRAGNSYFLAKCFVDAGVEIPKEIFVGIFGR